MSRSTNALATAVAGMLLLASTLVNTALAVGYRDFGALDDAALFPADHLNQNHNSGLGPRLFANGMPPIPALPAAAKGKRQTQTPGQCGENQHSCLDVGPAGAALCCRNDQYCFLNSTWQPQCCGLGTTCGSPCQENALYCNSTTVSTVTVATSATVTLLVATSEVAACCGRRCSSSSFLCQADFGNQCCGYGAQCLSGGSCLYTSTAMSTVVTPIPSGCTTSQFACTEGGGCCNFGSTCTSQILGTMTSQACAANLTVVNDSNGLSEGAKVGIGVGIAVGAAVVIGALTWFFVRRRREKSRQGTTLRGSGGPDDEDGNNDLVRPFMGHGGGAASDVTSPSTLAGIVGGRPPVHEHGRIYPYYGPDAVDGPYTDRNDSVPGRNLSTEPSRSSPGFSVRGAMPAMGYPDRPNDIVNPVELDADANGRATRVELEDKGLEMASTPIPDEKDDEHGPFELYGSPGTSPAPMTAEEAERRRTQNLSPTPPPVVVTDEQKKDDEKK